MRDIVERLRDTASEAGRLLARERAAEAADTITRFREEVAHLKEGVEKLKAALEKAEGGFYNMANAIDDYDYHGPAPQCTGDIIGHREQFHRVHVEQLVKYAEECRAALGFTPLHKETSND
jgi:hypothetical protein